MAYSVIKDKNITISGIVSYLVDNEEDIANLPVNKRPGSTARVVGTQTTYILNNSYTWVKVE